MEIKRSDFLTLPKGTLIELTINLYPSKENIVLTAEYSHCFTVDDYGVCSVYGYTPSVDDGDCREIMEFDSGCYTDLLLPTYKYSLPVVSKKNN
jgi:hypothetical protein